MVDDEPDLDLLIKQRFRREISKRTYKFSFARNGAQALRALKINPDIKLVVTDLNMPEMNGIELMIQLRSRFPQVKNMVISAYSDHDSITTARRAGAIDFITKPIDFVEFERKLEHIKYSATNASTRI
jgi:DNA-binding NtrC family response regulator